MLSRDAVPLVIEPAFRKSSPLGSRLKVPAPKAGTSAVAERRGDGAIMRRQTSVAAAAYFRMKQAPSALGPLA